MTTFSFAQRPLLLMLGLTFSAVATMSAQAQSQSYRPNKPQSGLIVSSASTDSRAGITLRNLTRVLPGFWASTQPSKAYMISSTMVRRAADGSITFMEETGPYKFDPTVTPEVLLKNGPRFVDLLLGHYATQEKHRTQRVDGCPGRIFRLDPSRSGKHHPWRSTHAQLGWLRYVHGRQNYLRIRCRHERCNGSCNGACVGSGSHPLRFSHHEWRFSKRLRIARPQQRRPPHQPRWPNLRHCRKLPRNSQPCHGQCIIRRIRWRVQGQLDGYDTIPCGRQR